MFGNSSCQDGLWEGRHRRKGLWFKWKPDVCIWLAIPQWRAYEFHRKDFIFVLRRKRRTPIRSLHSFKQNKNPVALYHTAETPVGGIFVEGV